MTPGAGGHAIFVNGIPSAGKSSVASEIEARTSTLQVFTGDDVIRQVPFEQRVAAAQRLFAMTLDEIEQRLESTNLIVDGAWNERQISEARDRFAYQGLFVILRIDESERQRRESMRKDRRLAYLWDPAWHHMPGPDDLYDLVIDSKIKSAAQCATEILTKAQKHWDDLSP